MIPYGNDARPMPMPMPTPAPGPGMTFASPDMPGGGLMPPWMQMGGPGFGQGQGMPPWMGGGMRAGGREGLMDRPGFGGGMRRRGGAGLRMMPPPGGGYQMPPSGPQSAWRPQQGGLPLNLQLMFQQLANRGGYGGG